MREQKKKQTILVVDDQATNVQALANLLKSEYRILVANSGERALAIAAESSPDMVLLDVQMPGVDGYEVCYQLKSNPKTSQILVIFVTALGTVSDEEEGFRLGAVDYISKPFHPAIIRARIRTHMTLKLKTDLLEQIAMLDGLTGIPNRRFFDTEFERESGRCERSGEPLSLIMMDIDHFKGYNDNYGHGAGDETLVKVARTLSDAFHRSTDLVARYGGEEFIALLPGSGSEGALHIAEVMRSSVERLAIEHKFSAASEVVTLSLGISSWPPREGELCATELLTQADQALYRSKSEGRNRVTHFSADSD